MNPSRSAGILPALAVAAVVTTVLVLAACGSGSSTPDPTAGCAAFCTTLTANCTAGNAQFATEGACNTYCRTARTTDPDFWSAGTAGATSGDSLACRTYHAGQAATIDPLFKSAHCKHAGPTGGSACGSLCENYCALAASLCTGGNVIPFTAGCATDCLGFAPDGANDAISGDSVQCRINHFGLIVAGGSAATHCGHARPVPTGACVNP